MARVGFENIQMPYLKVQYAPRGTDFDNVQMEEGIWRILGTADAPYMKGLPLETAGSMIVLKTAYDSVGQIFISCWRSHPIMIRRLVSSSTFGPWQSITPES